MTDAFPYRHLGLEPPPLSTVYVRQQVQQSVGPKPAEPDKPRDRRPELKDRVAPTTTDQPMSASDALNQHEHLIVIGEPGGGKSTLSRHLAWHLSRIWLGTSTANDAPLREPVAPLFVAARDLAGDGSWSQVLSRASSRTLGGQVIAPPVPALFENLVQGARWLVFVDGLDEIIDRESRAKVVDNLAAHARPGSPYRFVVTTRPRPDDELAPLRGGHIGTYTIQPFGRPELRDFARRWFTKQSVEDAEDLIQRYLHQTADGRLRELVRNPLLATIAAVALTIQPDRPLPTNRIDLYNRFYELITDEDASDRATEIQLQKSWPGRPGKQQFASWVHTNQSEFVDLLALEQVLGSDQLLAAASQSVRERGDAPPRPRDWEIILREVLLTTGLFTPEDHELRFLHHSLAEFLAARAYAADIPANFPDLEEWVQRGLLEAERTLTLFTFVVWAQSPDGDLNLLLDYLQSGDINRLLLAGRLLAEVASDVGAPVVDRLVELGIAQTLKDTTGAYYEVPEAFSVLAELSGNELVTTRLRSLLNRKELRPRTRIEVAIVLGHVAEPDQALDYIEGVLTGAGPWELLRAAEALAILIPDEPQHARQLLMQLHGNPPRSADARVALARGLYELGDSDRAIQMARSVLDDPRSDADVVVAGCEMWLAAAGPDSANEIVEAICAMRIIGSCQPKPLVSALVKHGCQAEAITLAKVAMTHETRQGWDLADAVEPWLSVAGPSAVEELRGLLAMRQVDPWVDARLAELACGLGYNDLAVELARKALTNPAADGTDKAKAAEAWFTATPEALDEVLPLLDEWAGMTPWDRAAVAECLAEIGEHDRAVELASAVLADPTADQTDMAAAARAWFAVQSAGAPEGVLAALDRRTALNAQERASLAETLAANDCDDLAMSWAQMVLADPSADEPALRNATQVVMSTAGAVSAADVVRAVRDVQPAQSLAAVADTLIDSGALIAAASLWRVIAVETAVASETRWSAVDLLVASGHSDMAIDALRTALANSGTKGSEQAQLRQLLAWAILANPDMTIVDCSAGLSTQTPSST